MPQPLFVFSIGTYLTLALHTRGTGTIRLPFIGEAFLGGGLTAWSSWKELRQHGEA
jgi:hypothetical protein